MNESIAEPQAGGWLRVGAWLVFALLVIIAFASGFLRLAAGVAALAGASEVVRGIHRVSATAAALVIVLIATQGWDRFQPLGRARGVMIALIVLAVALAWLGLHTPSQHPIVTFGNPLGGLAMVGLAWWLCLVPSRSGPARYALAGALALVAIAVTIAIVLWPPSLVPGLGFQLIGTGMLLAAVTLAR